MKSHRIALLFAVVSLARSGFGQCATWSALSQPNGTSYNYVTALTTWDRGSGPELYVGGSFSSVGTVAASCVAKWDGTTWSPLGGGVGGSGLPSVSCLEVFDDGSGPALFVGGNFSTAGGTTVNHIAKWNGTSWANVGGGVTQTGLSGVGVSDMAVFDDGSGPALFVAGTFSHAGGVAVGNVAKWNGSTWSPLGGGVSGPHVGVGALHVHDDGSGPALYVGGNFTSPFNGIARWRSTGWSAVGAGIMPVGYSGVGALASFDDGSGPALYAGGGFVTAGGTTASHIARWDGTNWSAVGQGFDNLVAALKVFDDGSGPALFTGGTFQFSGGTFVSRIARWDGGSWNDVGGGVEGYVYDLEVFDDGSDAAPDLIAGGVSLGSSPPAAVLKAWRGCEWQAYCSGDGTGAACPCGNSSPLGSSAGCLNSLGIGGRLQASGAPRVSADTFVLIGDQMPNAAALYFQGTLRSAGGAGTAFGDGLRCVTGSVTRLGAKTNASGASQYPAAGDVPISLAGGIGPVGGTRLYQAWYRNAAAFCTPSTFNLSNGVRASWVP